jgi:hypothetical protein
MEDETKVILSKGLGEGFSSKNGWGKVERAGFQMDTTHHEGPEGNYDDRWTGNQNAAGQELSVNANGGKASRVYGGGSLEEEGLGKLGLTGKDVMKKLVFFITRLGDKTRLDEEAVFIDGDWRYSYKILENVREIPVLVGEEKIKFQDKLVFIHFHINTPIK